MSEQVIKTVENVDKMFSQIVVNGETFIPGKTKTQDTSKLAVAQPIVQRTRSSSPSRTGEDVYGVNLNDVLHMFSDQATKQNLSEETRARTQADTEIHSELSAVSAEVIQSKTDIREIKSDITTMQSNIASNQTDIENIRSDITDMQSDITNIQSLIPEQATEDNQLTDKDFVNSSIATNTANFLGTYNTFEEIEEITDATNNDYVFFKTTDESGNVLFKRYKYNASEGSWLFEYDLNNSSFTSEQWKAINSGITKELVSKLSALDDIDYKLKRTLAITQIGTNWVDLGDLALEGAKPFKFKGKWYNKRYSAGEAGKIIKISTDGVNWVERTITGADTETQEIINTRVGIIVGVVFDKMYVLSPGYYPDNSKAHLLYTEDGLVYKTVADWEETYTLSNSSFEFMYNKQSNTAVFTYSESALYHTYVSSDGVTWSKCSGIPGRYVSIVNGKFFAFGSSDTTETKLFVSDDGYDWQECVLEGYSGYKTFYQNGVSTGSTSSAKGIFYADGIYVTTVHNGTYPSIVTSSDGITWTLRRAIQGSMLIGTCLKVPPTSMLPDGMWFIRAQASTTNWWCSLDNGVTWTAHTFKKDSSTTFRNNGYAFYRNGTIYLLPTSYSNSPCALLVTSATTIDAGTELCKQTLSSSYNGAVTNKSFIIIGDNLICSSSVYYASGSTSRNGLCRIPIDSLILGVDNADAYVTNYKLQLTNNQLDYIIEFTYDDGILFAMSNQGKLFVSSVDDMLAKGQFSI